MNDRLKDFAEVTGKALRDSFSKIDKVYILFIAILVRSFFQNYKYVGMFGGNVASGLINYFIEAILMCFVAQALRSVVVYGNTGKKSISSSIANFISPVLSTLFYLYLAEMVIGLVIPFISFSLYTIVMVLFQFMMSAVIEEVYISGNMGFSAMKNSAKFVCDNILTYGIFSIIYILVEFYITYGLTLGLGFSPQRFIYILVIAIVQLFFYMVRGHLYKYLKNHSYRQRKFMRG